MIKRRRFPKIFFGWWTVLACGVVALIGHGYNAYGISALFKPISTELDFNRTVTSVASSIGRLEGGFEAPLTGWITDKYGPRWIIIFGICLISTSLILMNWINTLWQYYLVWGIMLGTGCNIALTLPGDVAISNWFVRKRGLALSIKWVFSGLSGVLVLPLIALMIKYQDWRTACVAGGIAMAVIGLPLTLLFVKQRRPEYYGMLPDGATVEEETVDTEQMIDQGAEYAAEFGEIEFTARQAMRTPAYWLMILVQAIHGLVAPVMSIHCIPFLTDRGIDPLVAAGMMAIMLTASIPARFVGGFIADRISTGNLRFLMGVVYFLQAIGITIFLLNQTVAMIYVWFILYGIGHGASLTINNLMRARYFGRKALGSIRGSSMMFMTPVGVVAPIYAGWVYDTTGNYLNAFILFAGLLALSAAIFPFVKPPKPPAKVTDIRQIL
ncbi:MAG: MFS transporter [Dehalococcoidales bacterium]|nr:MAG: MFS transporter [Dehalococcoidales bacterium]